MRHNHQSSCYRGDAARRLAAETKVARTGIRITGRSMPLPLQLNALIRCSGIVLLACALACSEPTELNAKEAAVAKQTAKTEPAVAAKITTVANAMQSYGDLVRGKLKPLFSSFKVEYPPKEMTWICLKQEKLLLVFARDQAGKMRSLLSFPIIGASGVPGPKLKEGDKQVPEGFYRILGFRPNVVAHLGLAVDNPNTEDRVHAKKEARKNLGGDILIHGSRWSTGCLAMGNEPIEQLFVLAHDSGASKIQLIFAPCDLTLTKPDVDFKTQPSWLPELYKRLRSALQSYPLAEAQSTKEKP